MNEPNPLILCVDDEELPLRLRKLVLEKHGYEVIAAHSAEQAALLLESHPVSLVLTDHLMPGGTGVELAQIVKQTRPHVPVVVISGVNELPSDADIADLFISKVEGPAAMCGKISSLLAERRNSRDETPVSQVDSSSPA